MVNASTFRRLLDPLVNRLRLICSRGVIRSVDDSASGQTITVELLRGETRAGVERFTQYGIVSVPNPGAEAVVLSIGGNRDHPIAIAVDDRSSRASGQAAGEVGLYDDLGKLLLLKRDGSIAITGATKVTIDGDLEVTGDITATGEITDRKTSMDTIRATHNAHQHLENGTGGGITDPPLNPFP